GAATSGVTMLRFVGGSLGTAVFGTVFSNRLASALAGLGGARAGGAHHATGLTRDQLVALPAPARAAYQHAFVHSLRPVFLVAAGAAALGFLLAWLLEERPLRETASHATGLDDALAAP